MQWQLILFLSVTYCRQILNYTFRMAFSFSVGQLFGDYSTLQKEVKHFETSNFVKSDCRKISASAARCPDKTFNEGILYSQLKYSCCHGGKAYKSRSRGDRRFGRCTEKDSNARIKKVKLQMNQVLDNIQLTSIPGSEDWVCT